MTVEAITRKAGSYVCRPGTVYPFGFKVFSASDVYVVLAENGIEARAAYGTDYVVRLNDNQDNEPGGEVVLLCEAAGKSVTIGSCVPYTQEVVITNKGGFYPTILNKAYDKLTILVQQLLEEVSRCVKVPISGQEKPDALIQTLYESALTAKENAQLSVMKAEDAAASAESAAESADDAATSAAASAESAEEAYRWANMPENELVQTDDHVGYSAWHHAQKAKENADAAASAIMPGALVGQLFYGQIILSAVPLDSDGLRLLDGSPLKKGGRYDKFIAHIAELKEKYPDLFVTETAWWAIDKEFGSCGKFVLGEDSIRLPRVSDILQCTTDPNAVGDMVKAGLPNITGKLYGWLPSAGISPTYAEDSALYWPDARADNAMATVKRECNDSLSFDASRNNPLYGASDTVQPQTLKVLAYIVVDAVDVDALNALLKTVNEEGVAGQVLVKGENSVGWGNRGIGFDCQWKSFLVPGDRDSTNATGMERVLDTAYINDTGIPLAIVCSVRLPNRGVTDGPLTCVQLEICPKGGSWQSVFSVGPVNGVGWHSVFSIVPPEASYRCIDIYKNVGLFGWAELRPTK